MADLITSPILSQATVSVSKFKLNPKAYIVRSNPHGISLQIRPKSTPALSIVKKRRWAPTAKASADFAQLVNSGPWLWFLLVVHCLFGSAEFVSEPGTNVKFPTVLSVPGCSDSLVLLGTGYREKVFAIIGVKVYAAGLYTSPSIVEKLSAWEGRSAAEIQEDSSLSTSVYEAPLEKSLQIVLVRDVDGKTFWDALQDAISTRIKEPSSVDESALSTFHSTFQGRPLKQGTSIFLTWVEPSKMLVSISSDMLPSAVDAVTESINVASALFDVFLGDAPVSPPLKASVANGLAMLLN